METRFVKRVGSQVRLHKLWGECPEDEWNGAHFGATPWHHVAGAEASATLEVAGLVERPDAYVCDKCGEKSPHAEPSGYGRRPLYDTPSGDSGPGALFYVNHDPDDGCFFGWENCDGSHLTCVLPNGHQWSIDQRASNCGRREDKTHRCWVRHGDPEKGEPVHVDKNGDTCTAGAGSILAGDYHGFLHNGRLTTA